jgi:nucleoporin POM152
LPILLNQTNPTSIELLRLDLDKDTNETITVSKKELNRLKKQANKVAVKNGKSEARSLELSVQKTGLYRLQRVVDESHLEVQRKTSDTLVVPCPVARVKPVARHKCKGDLSDFNLEVEATTPFKVKYTKAVDDERYSQVVLSIHPENLLSPLVSDENLGKVTAFNPGNGDISWARTQTVNVPLNESLGASGLWEYIVDEVHDACGNSVDYSSFRRDNPATLDFRKDMYPRQTFVVHERPKIAFNQCDPKNPLMAPKGKPQILPLRLEADSNEIRDDKHRVSYLFTPYTDLYPNQEHAKDAVRKEVIIGPGNRQMQVKDPGLYTLISLWTSHCAGEVMEPSSCLFLNPPEPDLEITHEDIPDICAGNSIGLLVNLSMTGTPPFRILYHTRQSSSGLTTPKVIDIDRHQARLELKPADAGNYTYEFMHISDSVYTTPRSLETKKLILEQAVKPPPYAVFFELRSVKTACMEQSLSIEVLLRGEAPWILEYEIVYKGRRQKFTEDNIDDPFHLVTTEKLMEGGVYSLLLTSVTDRSGCKVLLEDEMRIEVGLQKPKVAFGQIDGRRSISALIGKKISLPLRLQGEPPWTVSYRNRALENGTELSTYHFKNNDQIEIDQEGTFELVSVHDKSCLGSVDMHANQFIVQWIAKPAISIAQTSITKKDDGTYVKRDVCEGDEDITDISFSGSAPFTVEYNQYFKSDLGTHSKRSQQFTSGLDSASFKMETAKAGLYEYEFSRLGDNSYSQASRGPIDLRIQQRVQSQPSARFTNIGKTYRYCKGEGTGDEVLPIALTGLAPFHVEIDIRHHSTTKPERIRIPHIETNQYNFHIPHKYLALGTHAVTIRKVRDSHGCAQEMDFDAPHVQVSVADLPTISPLEAYTDFCVGNRISFSLSGTPPFNIFYKFQGFERKATVSTTTFRRIAEKPGVFEIIGISDQRSTDACMARTSITKTIHEMPSVKISKGRTVTVDIHEGGEAEILFEFGGTPPFEFT